MQNLVRNRRISRQSRAWTVESLQTYLAFMRGTSTLLDAMAAEAKKPMWTCSELPNSNDVILIQYKANGMTLRAYCIANDIDNWLQRLHDETGVQLSKRMLAYTVSDYFRQHQPPF